MPIHRSQLQKLARARLRDAKALFDAGQWSGAYYLSGYAVECGLKAAIAKQFSASTIPDPTHVRSIYTHKLPALVNVAGLQTRLDADSQSDPDLELNWGVVKDWDEGSRYEIWSRSDAEGMLSAISDRRHGVMKWLRSVW